MKRKHVAAAAMVLALLVIGSSAVWLWLRPKAPHPVLRGVTGDICNLEIIATTLLSDYYRGHGEYPEELEPLLVEVGWASPPLKSGLVYFAARDEGGKRFACIVINPWDGKVDVKGECFTADNVGKRLLHWKPPRCACETYVYDRKKNLTNSGPHNDLCLQLIWNKYCVNSIGAKPEGFLCVEDIPDLSSPPPLPSKPEK